MSSKATINFFQCIIPQRQGWQKQQSTGNGGMTEWVRGEEQRVILQRWQEKETEGW